MRPFLSAVWQSLLMLNYEVDPSILAPYLPRGIELDLWQGKALVSMVGFRFLNTRVLSAAVPFHRNFEEVNLRFYVRRTTQDEVRRGVVFIKEIVPRFWIAQIARRLYGENYVSLPMGHTIERDRQGNLCRDGLVEYKWRWRGRIHRMGGLATGDPQPILPGSEEEYITEHYWGYTRRSAQVTHEYPVEHPRWQVRPVAQPYLLCNIQDFYGDAFVPFLRRPPRSAFLAEGSPIQVGWGKRI